ncbi:MAG: peptidase [Pseudomonadota bacterium]
MTYCVALKVDAGVVMLSDTRTNAGVDHVSRYRKSFTWQIPGERSICLMTAGNLSITQAIVTRIGEALRRADVGEDVETILNARSMFRVVQIVGELMDEMQARHRPNLLSQGVGADATVLVTGQRKGGGHRAFMVYSPGNFIEATIDTPFLQAGEFKYGKPILDRVVTRDMSIPDAVKAVFLSMDSTVRSNLSVGMPLDLVVLPVDTQEFSLLRRVNETDTDWTAVSKGWGEALRACYGSLPDVDMLGAASD